MKTSSKFLAALILPAVLPAQSGLEAQNKVVPPTGQFLTPAAAPGSTLQQLATGLRADGNADASQAVKTALSPDGKTLLVLTSRWNTNNKSPDGVPFSYPLLDPLTGEPSKEKTVKAEWVFVYTVNPDGSVAKRQQLNIPSTYGGLVWDPSATRFYVSGGANDRVVIYKLTGAKFAPDAPFILLGHNSNQTAPLSTPDGSILKGTPMAKTAAVHELHDAAWWAKKMKNLDFSDADENDDDDFNHILWSGLMRGRRPYPSCRSGADLTENREELLKKWQPK